MTLAELIALNDEIRALVRSGVPLEDGLAAVAREWPGALGERAAELSERLRAGQDLAQVLSDPQWEIAPVYRAVVVAGSRAGRLEAALEGVSTSARLLLETRRSTTTALIYPVILLFVAYGVVTLMLTYVLPTLLAAQENLLDQPSRWLPWATSLARSARYWAPWPPIVGAAWLAWWWWRSGRAVAWERPVRFWFRASPARARHLGIHATFAEVLALLVEHAVPLADAVELAADASGGAVLVLASRKLSGRLRRGETLCDSASAESKSWLLWLIGSNSPRLPTHLRNLARQYRDEAMQLSQWLTRVTPLVVTAVAGGIAVLLYALLLFIPYSQLMQGLSRP